MRSSRMALKPWHRCALAMLLVALSSAPAHAAASADASADANAAQLAELQRKLDASLLAIKALTERVRELEARQAGTAAAAAPAAAAAAPAASPPAPEAAKLEATEKRVEELEKANASRNAGDTGLPLHGFADVGAGTHNPINAGLKGFNVGNLDFYLAPRLGDRTRALFELNTEVGFDGTVGVDLERAQIGYQFGDEDTVWLGRFHTPYGYLNTSLHHGAWINDSLRRPQFLQFEDSGGILPAHTVGLWLTGSRPAGAGKLRYDLYAGNDQQIVQGILDMRNAGGPHGGLMGGGRIGYQFSAGAAEGLVLGLHALSTRIDDDAANVTRVRAYGGYAAYDTDQWEGIAEIYLFDNQDLSGGSGSHSSNAGFAQLGYRRGWGVPYARYERTSLDQTDAYFAQLRGGASYHRVALGVRFDIDLKSALKLELANTRLTDRTLDQYGEGLVQYAIRF
jgi:hypothetical protein